MPVLPARFCLSDYRIFVQKLGCSKITKTFTFRNCKGENRQHKVICEEADILGPKNTQWGEKCNFVVAVLEILTNVTIHNVTIGPVPGEKNYTRGCLNSNNSKE